LNSGISQRDLESYLWGAANLLRGTIDPGEYKNIIFPLMFFKRISDAYDEEFEIALSESNGDLEYASFSENHRFQIPDGAHWKDIRTITSNVGKSIKDAMTKIENANIDKLSGIFGDTNWTNKERLSDKNLIDLIEHFSSINLSVKNIPQDEFGNAYEYLIKKFADDSGHTAAEFYTNRTVVRLMALICDPKSGETVYDPTCGSGGMLLNALLLAKEKGEEYRNIKLYGQEINLITSAIARMNMFIHGIEDFEIVRGDTLSNPAFIENDKVMQFDVVMANPPYSVSKWNRESWKHDKWKRNAYGLPPQGNADYAFFQHIIASMKEGTGRCAILFPHGILVRDAEYSMRKKIIEEDIIEGIIGLGENLFYNSSMEACIVICNKKKPLDIKGKIIFINAKNEIVREKTQSYLTEENIKNIWKTYLSHKDLQFFSAVIGTEQIIKNDYNLNIKHYIKDERYIDKKLLSTPIKDYINEWNKSTDRIQVEYFNLKNILEDVS